MTLTFAEYDALPGAGVAFTVERFADREAWLAGRRSNLGGSDAPALWGYARASTKQGQPPLLAVWADKRGNVPDESDEWLEIGACLEPGIRTLYGRRTGRRVNYPGEHVRLRSLRWPFLAVSLDGVTFDEVRAGCGVLEIKNRGGFARWDDGVPLPVQIQVQHAMTVTGWSWSSCCALLGGNRFAWADVERDEPFIALHVDRCRRLWDAVESGDAPEADDSEMTARALAALYPKDDGATVDLDERAQRWADTWLEADADEKKAATAGRWAENKLRRAIGAAQAARLPDGRTLALKTQKNGIRVLRIKGNDK